MGRLKVQLRGGFSDRMGIKPINTQLQIDSLDERTRAALSNTMLDVENWHIKGCRDIQDVNILYAQVLREVYVQYGIALGSVDIAYVRACMNDTILSDEYDSVLTLIEYFAGKLNSDFIYGVFNSVFEKEYVGYRFVGGKITPITDSNEISAIEEAMSSPYDEVNDHLAKAAGFLADRQNPDYENSAKESISAVERMCSIILGKSATLGEALKKLEANGVVIHKALNGAFEKLYGYTSDASGVRHAGQLGGENTTFEEAKFMLVSCCAFINYLKGVLAKTT